MKKLALISTLTLLLTACGGGGGSASTAGNASTPNTPPATNPSHPSTPNSILTVGGKYISVLPHSVGPNAVSVSNHVVEIAGQTYDLSSQFGANINGWRHQSANIVTGTQLPNIGTAYVKQGAEAKVGLINPKNTAQFVAYFDGTITPLNEIPTGVAKYDSQVAVMNKNNHQMSRLEITADFANKKLSSPVIPGTDIRLDSDITGNTFEAPDSNPAMVKGRFFGTNASEIGGAFEDDEIIGAFHGVKQ